MKHLVLFFWAVTLYGQIPDGIFSEQVQEKRGKILAVVTSVGTNPNTGKPVGYELTELSRAFYVFQANGFEVDIASPEGGRAPAYFDEEDITDVDDAFMQDPLIKGKLDNTLRLETVDPMIYRGIYFVGGKGAFFDFPDNPQIQELTVRIYENDGVISAICHGPAALLNVTLSDGSYLIKDRKINSFTNDEELFLNEANRLKYPFLLEDELKQRGAIFERVPIFLENVTVDGRLVTGQNPWSTWAVAESMVRALGFEPVPRRQTATEAAVQSIMLLKQDGLKHAAAFKEGSDAFDSGFITLYTIVSLVEGDLSTAFTLVRLSDYTWAWLLGVLILLTLVYLVFRIVKKIAALVMRVFGRGRTGRVASVSMLCP